MRGARDLPADLIEHAAEALEGSGLSPAMRGYFARAVLAAVADHWPTPTTHRDQLADQEEVIAELRAIAAQRTAENDAMRNDLVTLRRTLGAETALWPCDNYTRPHTCLTAPSSVSARCEFCTAQAVGVLRDAAQVETEARAKAGEDIARACEAEADAANEAASDFLLNRAEAQADKANMQEAAFLHAARIARDTTAGTT